MLYYLKGKIAHKLENKIVLEVNDIAYLILVSKIEEFPLGETKTVYIHQVIKEEDNYLIGFLTLEEKEFFQMLIKVVGLGPKGAIYALGKSSPKEISNAIAYENIKYLSSLPGINQRIASQLVFELKSKITGKRGNSQTWFEVRKDLKSMGFMIKEIEPVLAKIDTLNLTSQEALLEALKMLRK
jgi:Holliday junction DNA helicase RuvA